MGNSQHGKSFKLAPLAQHCSRSRAPAGSEDCPLMQEIKLELSDETFVFFAELALLNDLPPEHFMLEAIETFRAYLTHNTPSEVSETDLAQIYPKKIH